MEGREEEKKRMSNDKGDIFTADRAPLCVVCGGVEIVHVKSVWIVFPIGSRTSFNALKSGC